MSQDTKTLSVKFTKQQLVFIEMLKNEGRFGQKVEDIVLTVFREYVRSTLPNLRSGK